MGKRIILLKNVFTHFLKAYDTNYDSHKCEKIELSVISMYSLGMNGLKYYFAENGFTHFLKADFSE